MLVTAAVPELVELTAAVLATVRRLLQEMDLDERIRRQMRSSRFAPRVPDRSRGPVPGSRARSPPVPHPFPRPSPPAAPPTDSRDDPLGDPDAATELMPRIDVDARTQLMARIERDRLTGEPRLPGQAEEPPRDGSSAPD